MSRTAIAAVLAMLLLFAPAASARPVDVSYPAYPTPEVHEPTVMPERISDTGGTAAKPTVRPEIVTDHREKMGTGSLAGSTEKSSAALAQEQYLASQGEQLAALAREQESVSPSGNQGLPPAEDDNAPWAIVALGIAAAGLVAGSAIVATRRTRARVAA